MSQENVEVVRAGFLAAGSTGDPEAARRYFDPDIEWDMSGVAGWAEKPLYRGPEVARFLRAWADSWAEWRFDLEEVRDASPEKVFAAIHEHGIGAASGTTVEQRRYFATTLRNGYLVRVQMFSDCSDALKAAGLEE